MIKDWFNSYRGFVEIIKKGSVMSPLLALCWLLFPGCLLITYLTSSESLQIFCEWVMAGTLCAYIGAYFMWSFRDPARLHSEEHYIRELEVRQGTKYQDNLPNSSAALDHQQPNLTLSEAEQPDTLQISSGQAVTSERGAGDNYAQ